MTDPQPTKSLVRLRLLNSVAFPPSVEWHIDMEHLLFRARMANSIEEVVRKAKQKSNLIMPNTKLLRV